MRKKILIVEDAPDIRDALKQLVEMCGHAAVTAKNGFDCLRRAHAEHPDLILLALDLPDLNGDQVIKEIRADASLADVPVLCVSSYTEGREAELIQLGFNEVFSKMKFVVLLEATMKKYLEK